MRRPARLAADAGQAAGHRIAANHPGRHPTVAVFVDQICGQPGEAPVGVGCGGPGERDAGRLGLRSQLLVEIPHHLDVVGDKSDGTNDYRFRARGTQRREMIGDVRLQPRNLRRPRSRLPGHIVIGVPGGRRDQPCGISDLAAVKLRTAALIGGHRD